MKPFDIFALIMLLIGPASLIGLWLAMWAGIILP